TPKIGAGHAAAMARQGLAELRAAMYPSSNVAQPPQYGIYGTRTPGEVMEDKEKAARDPDERPSILGERLKQAERDVESHEPQPPQQELERD
ncbi:MAG: hypothetical protein KF678_07090, partial [Phycisphaeraceae bacterium]|nr:hypothetical protein [Phycisphaeraceae bacterium]